MCPREVLTLHVRTNRHGRASAVLAVRAAIVVVTAVALGACAGDDGGDKDRQASGSGQTGGAPSASPPPAPDAGTPAGHAGDAQRVAVPDVDRTPPSARIVLAPAGGGAALATTAQPGGPAHPAAIRLAQPRLRGTTIGRDANGGVARVRVSIRERIVCRAEDGTRFVRERTRYFPPPQIEVIRARPGALLPTRKTRTRDLALADGRCGPRAEPNAVYGELWGEAIDGYGLEAVTPHIRFSYRG